MVINISVVNPAPDPYVFGPPKSGFESVYHYLMPYSASFYYENKYLIFIVTVEENK
jgi:hypothetical protein